MKSRFAFSLSLHELNGDILTKKHFTKKVKNELFKRSFNADESGFTTS